MIDLDDLLDNVSDTFKETLEEVASNQCPYIHRTDFGDIRDDGAILLARLLCVNTSVKQVVATGNKIGERGGIALAEALKQNTNLELLSLGKNPLGPKAGQAFAEALKTNTTLKDIVFDVVNNFDTDTALAFAGMLNNNTSLTSFFMTYQHLGPDAGCAFATMLEKNATLTHLNLNHNNFGPGTENEFARALSKNKTLTWLDLGSNSLGTDTGLSLAKALEQNTTIQELLLADNNFDSEVATAFAKVIRSNTTLHNLDLSGNKFSADACLNLVDALENNTALTRFAAPDFGRHLDLHRRIATYLQRNEKIQKIRKQIEALSPDAPYSDIDKVFGLDLTVFNFKRYQNILAKIAALPDAEFSEKIKQRLKDEAMLVRCSWDNGDDIDARIKQLKDIIIRAVSKDPKSLKIRALTCLAPIVFTKAVQCSKTESTKASATRYLVEACVAALHGQHNETTKGILCDAVSLWLGKKSFEATLQQLWQDLQQHDIQSFKELFISVCLDLGLPPFNLQIEIIKPVPLLFSIKDLASCGDSKESAESKSLSHKSETIPRRKTDSEARFTSALSLDADAGLDREGYELGGFEQESHAQAHFNAHESNGEGNGEEYSEAEAKSEAEEQMVQQGIMNSLQTEPPRSKPT